MIDQLFARHWAEERLGARSLVANRRRQPRIGHLQRQEFRLAAGSRPHRPAPIVSRSTARCRGAGTLRPAAPCPPSLEAGAAGLQVADFERYVCRRGRVGDLPGSEVPAAYQSFVRTRDMRAIQGIIEHNALDLATLVELGSRLLRPERAELRSGVLDRSWLPSATSAEFPRGPCRTRSGS